MVRDDGDSTSVTGVDAPRQAGDVVEWTAPGAAAPVTLDVAALVRSL